MARSRGAELTSRIRIGVGGWTYAPWGGVFYPVELPHRRELEFASRHLTSIEINGTYYGLQKPDTFARWHDETPDDFVFALKGSRFITNRRVLAGAGEAIERFFGSGLTELKNKLGPINWQLAATKAFDPDDIAAFFKLLPKQIDRRPLRHAIEARHDSFRTAEFVALAREYDVAIVLAGDSQYPLIAEITAPFVYARIMGTSEAAAQGYSDAELDAWAARARVLASGLVPKELKSLGAVPGHKAARDVFLYVISGHKERNPAAAMGLIARVG